MRALDGILTPTASSTALTEDRAWVYVQTPHDRCTKCWASLGSLPWRINSIPRNICPELQAFLTLPPSTSTSIRRWPSILVIGSIVILFPICLLPFVKKDCPQDWLSITFLHKMDSYCPRTPVRCIRCRDDRLPLANSYHR